MNKKSLIIGVTITCIWFLGIYRFCFLNGYKLPESLNELGDFLAGIFAPVAFFWLILGYMQQGKQLDQNTKALEQQERALQLQIDEMKESVQQQKEIAKTNEKSLQASFEKERPEITYIFPSSYKHGEGHFSLVFKVHNVGKGDCYNLSANVLDGKSSTCILNFLKVRSLATISISTFAYSFGENLDKNIYKIEDFSGWDDNEYTGKSMTVNINLEYENVYGHKFEEILEIKFLFKKDFDTMLRQYNFDRE